MLPPQLDRLREITVPYRPFTECLRIIEGIARIQRPGNKWERLVVLIVAERLNG